jgi:hypothetical protein
MMKRHADRKIDRHLQTHKDTHRETNFLPDEDLIPHPDKTIRNLIAEAGAIDVTMPIWACMYVGGCMYGVCIMFGGDVCEAYRCICMILLDVCDRDS